MTNADFVILEFCTFRKLQLQHCEQNFSDIVVINLTFNRGLDDLL